MITEVKNANSFQKIEIPNDWEASKLDNVINEMTDYVAAGSFESLRNNVNVIEGSGFAYYVRLTDLRLGLGHQEQKYVDEKSYTFLRKSNLFGNELLMANIGANVGETWLMPVINTPATIAPNMIVVKVDNNKLLPDFLFYYTHSPIGFSKLEELISGSGHPKINKGELKKLIVPLPTLPEQKAIAKLLSTADTAIHTTEKLIAQKELRKKWLMQQLLTGKKRLKEFGQEWKFVRFKEIYTQVKQKAGDEKFLVLSVTKDGIVSQAEYFNKEIASEDTSPYLVVRKGDMAMSGLNFWMGSIDVLVEYEIGMISPAYKVFEIHNPEISAAFMKSFVRSEIMLQCLIGSSVVGASIVRRNLDRETLDEWSFRMPSLEEQNAIAQLLHAADKEIILLKAKAEKLREQKKGLMQVLLTGKVRLKINERK